MILFPAIDLLGGKAVRLFQGRYDEETVYDDEPVNTALKFKSAGCEAIHIVDLDGAKYGTTVNLDTVLKIKRETGLFCEIGGGIRNLETVDRYIDSGIDRVILGTAAIENKDFLKAAAAKYGNKIAVGADIKDGFIAVKGWLENSEVTVYDFFEEMQGLGIDTIICTDISRDGAMKGTNTRLYKELSEKYTIKITASGGVSTYDDIKALKEMNIYAAIIGKAYYTGAINLKEAIGLSR